MEGTENFGLLPSEPAPRLALEVEKWHERYASRPLLADDTLQSPPCHFIPLRIDPTTPPWAAARACTP
jgi:hypothetical protein